MQFVDLAGKKFNRLTAIQRYSIDRSGSVVWECICDCGKQVKVRGSSLTTGHAKSCGCYKSDVKRKQMLGDKQPMRKSELRAKVAAKKNGELNPQWKGGISFEPYCTKFNNAFRNHIRDKFNDLCFNCNKAETVIDPRKNTVRKLSVHHIDYNHNSICNGKEWAFIPLCAKCHPLTNFNRWYWFNLWICYWAEPYWSDKNGSFMVQI
ncbi:hypothetical protein M0R72_12460 [Candidatus Pacearchaeota archaeon]|jgi:hypothetical protein|nr:hypothetical protein [Candidatus Pacearchaeota archaeon]